MLNSLFNDNMKERANKLWSMAVNFGKSCVPRLKAIEKLFDHPDMTLLALYAFAIAGVESIGQRFLYLQSNAIFSQWTTGNKPADGPTYNQLFISYPMAVIALVGVFFCYYMLKSMPRLHQMLVNVSEKIWGLVLGISLIVINVIPYFATKYYLSVVVGILGLRLAYQFFYQIRKPVAFDSEKKSVNLAAYGVAIILIAGSLWQAAEAWYPVKLTNDYQELSDKLVVPPSPNMANKSPMVLDRKTAFDCLIDPNGPFAAELLGDSNIISAKEVPMIERFSGGMGVPLQQPLGPVNNKNQKPATTAVTDADDCPQQFTQFQSDALRVPITQTGTWQSQAGRTLYHHSYIYVAATHFLKYGFTTPIPYLYGLGNTLFHAMLMKDGPITLTRYFETYPIAQITGIMVIVFSVFYITRSWLSVPFALALLLAPLYEMHFESIQLAPGFNPLRYAGVAAQIASIAFLFRHKSLSGILGLVSALAFSIFWNKEFAVMGSVGQMLALAMPQLGFRIFSRIAVMIGALAMSVYLIMLCSHLSEGFLQTIQAGIFGISVPDMSQEAFISLCVSIIMLAGVAVLASWRFDRDERAARLCIIPVLCLMMIKYIYNPSPVHYLFTLAFIFPVAAVFWNWQKYDQTLALFKLNDQQRRQLTSFVLVMVGLITFVEGHHYKNDARRREDIMFTNFEKNTWKELGETFQTTTPADPVVSRIKAVQQQVREEDSVVFLSPFDHMMSFYANPRKYCGHFEYITNLVTHKNIGDVIDCVRKEPDALVVYDEALHLECPVLLHYKHYEKGPRMSVKKVLYAMQTTMESCEAKKRLITSLQFIMDSLKPELVLVKKVGPLSFYRHAKSAN